ncbi:MAG: hypothetical protein ABIH41_02360, partial [Nanoarchaeota archaeon]
MRIIFSVLLICALTTLAASAYTNTQECVNLCNAGTYDESAKCFREFQEKKDAYFSVAQCALAKNDDAVAKDYALKSAKERTEWITLANRLHIPGVQIYTGGLGDTYVLAYIASGQEEHKNKAMEYLKTSRQCKGTPDETLCAQLYFNSSVSQMALRRGVMGGSTAKLPPKSLHGTITDPDGDPLKRVWVGWQCPGKPVHESWTDDKGYYEFAYEGELGAPDLCESPTLFVTLRYNASDNGKIYTQIFYEHNEVWIGKKLHPKNETDLKQDFQLKAGLTGADYTGSPAPRDIHHFSIMYKHMVEAIEFWRGQGINIDYKLPILVQSGYGGNATYYSPTDGDIYISRRDSGVNSSNRPKNREYHELNHHVMWSMYGSWPRVSTTFTAPNTNHGGYINPTTTDSFMEGFAEFFSLVIADTYNQSRPDVYASWGTLEKTHKAWNNQGLDEELAVAAVLWDLYDAKNDDKIDLDLAQTLALLKVRSEDFTDVYKKATTAYPASKSDLDRIFITQGFFVDRDPGNGTWDPQEPYRDANRNKRYDTGEYFIDYAQHPGLGKPWMVYDAGDAIGSASNYQRLARTNTVMTAGHFIKTSTTHDLFDVHVTYDDRDSYDTIADNRDGLIFVYVPTGEVKATVTVKPHGVSGKTLTIDGQAFEKEQPAAAARGYYVEFDFGIINPIAADVPQQTQDNGGGSG